MLIIFFFFQAEDGIRDIGVTGVQTCALPIFGQYLPRYLDREPVSVVQQERHLTREVPSLQPLYLGLEQLHPGVVDLYETRRLTPHDPTYVPPGRSQLLVEISHVIHDHLGETRDLSRIQTQPRISLSRRSTY